eukprot:4024420-Amphidinium_carterae.1
MGDMVLCDTRDVESCMASVADSRLEAGQLHRVQIVFHADASKGAACFSPWQPPSPLLQSKQLYFCDCVKVYLSFSEEA